MLWGHTVRSPHAHARIVEIDISEALTMPGVHAVLTHDGRPGREDATASSSPTSRCSRSTASATSASRSCSSRPSIRSRPGAPPSSIKVEYEPLELVVDPERATEQEPLHPDRPTMGHGYRDDPRPNVVRHMVIRHGDPDTAGDVTVEGVYEIGIQDQAFLGPESGLAVPDGEGGVDIYVATQWLHVDRDQVAPCLGLAPEQVRIHLAGVGGAFGGREDLSMQIHGAMLALHTSRPGEARLRPRGVVRRPRPPPPRADLGRAPRDPRGRLVCVRMRILLDGGAYASSLDRGHARTRPRSRAARTRCRTR